MNKSQRIYLDVNDTQGEKNIKIQLEQNIDTIEFLTMSIDSKEAYRDFNSDYGVLVGRVIANGGVGIPNAKISIFIPITDEDATKSDIYSIYPYKTPRDKNNEGKRYNLLPRVGRYNEDGTISPKQPFGSFPIKEEIIGNAPILEIYKKYYKYTALTNNAGDYMIFGVPLGTQTVHLSLDITDIGEYSMTPAAMVTNLGYSSDLFINNNSRIKPSNDLNDLPHIETQEITVDVIPFWGDKENFEIGITRQDFRVRAELTNTFTIFGNVFTDNYESRWAANWTDGKKFGIQQLYRINNGNNVDIDSKRIGNITETIFYYPNNISDAEIEDNGKDLASKMLILDKSQYTIHKNEGEFVFIINCNRRKIIKNESNNEIVVSDSYAGGVYTEFKGFITLEITEEDLSTPQRNFENVIANNTRSVSIFRTRIKIPQHALRNQSFAYTKYRYDWQNIHYKFEANKIYSVAKFNGLVQNTNNSDDSISDNGFDESDRINNLAKDPYWNPGVIRTGGDDNAPYEFPNNGNVEGGTKGFGANWLNFSIYLPNIGYVFDSNFGNMKANTFFQVFYGAFTDNFTNNNDFLIGETKTNTKWYLRSDLHWTDFIEVPVSDIKILNNYDKKGFDNYETYFADINTLTGDYRNGDTPPSWGGDPCPINGGGLYGKPVSSTNPRDLRFYFYKGFDTADSIKFVADILNI